MEPKGFLIYLNGGIAFASNNFGTNNTPPITWTKIIQYMVFIECPHGRIAFLFRFELLIFGGKKRLFSLNVKLKSLF
jgi:hypothetical protein